MADKFKEPNININKVYTRTGDKGKTRLIGGQARSKFDLRIMAYGDVDELNAVLGGCVEQVKKLGREHEFIHSLLKTLTIVQHHLFNLGTILSTLPEDLTNTLPKILDKDIIWLENQIDDYNKELSDLKSFVLPGGSEANSWFHLARTVSRRVERSIIALSEKEEIDPTAIQYINRISDAFFVWSRWLLSFEKIPEHLWDPNISTED